MLHILELVLTLLHSYKLLWSYASFAISHEREPCVHGAHAFFFKLSVSVAHGVVYSSTHDLLAKCGPSAIYTHM